jgi:tryptophan synthase beta chain
VLHGSRTFILQDEDGQTVESHSISAGLDYPGVGPEHSWLADIGRARYEPVTDTEAMDAFSLLCRTEGIIPAIESAHALAGALREGRRLGPGGLVLVNLSGRGDKDVDTAARWFGLVPAEDVVASEATRVALADELRAGADAAGDSGHRFSPPRGEAASGTTSPSGMTQ